MYPVERLRFTPVNTNEPPPVWGDYRDLESVLWGIARHADFPPLGFSIAFARDFLWMRSDYCEPSEMLDPWIYLSCALAGDWTPSCYGGIAGSIAACLPERSRWFAEELLQAWWASYPVPGVKRPRPIWSAEDVDPAELAAFL
jgi:hypothetical protein